MGLIKTNKNGVYTRTHNQPGIISYIITYRLNGKLYKKRLGSNAEGWNVSKAYKERQRRLATETVDTTDNSKIKFNDITEQYFESIKHKSDYLNTQGRYNNHIKGYIGSKFIMKITSQDIVSLKNKLIDKVSVKTGKKLSAKTVNDIVDLINTIYNYYNKLNYNNQIKSPADKNIVERYKVNNSRLRFLSKCEYEILLEAISNRKEYTTNKNTLQYRTDELLLYTKLLVTTGVRTYSALTIKAKDIDITNQTIMVHNHKANRIYTAYIHQSILDELKEIKHTIEPEQYIFGKSNKPYHRSTLNKRLKIILDRLFNTSITDKRELMCVHSFRHTFGSWLAQQGVSLYIICKLMDHKDISMTQVYSKLAPDSGKDIMKRFLN